MAKTTSKSPRGKKNKTPMICREVELCPVLSCILGGKKRMRRAQIVKKMWKIVRERNLLDPKDNRFAFTDNELQQVIKCKRFRVFGLMKYVEEHVRPVENSE